MTATPATHVFAHLGPAPYRFQGVTQNLFTVAGCPEASKPGGTCDHCGTGILWEFHLTAADGRAFKVGSSCILKSGDAGLRHAVTDHQRAQRARREATRRAAQAARPKSAAAAAWEAAQCAACDARQDALAARAVALAAKLSGLEDVLRALDTEADALGGVYESFPASLARQLRAEGSLSPRQADCALRLLYGRRSARNADALNATFQQVTTPL
jgi:hypothetical protein